MANTTDKVIATTKPSTLHIAQSYDFIPLNLDLPPGISHKSQGTLIRARSLMLSSVTLFRNTLLGGKQGQSVLTKLLVIPSERAKEKA